MNNSDKLIHDVYQKALLPNILLVLGGTINVFFDGVLVGQKLGDIGLDSVNQCLPFYLVLCTIGSLMASGVFSLSAIAVGDNNLEEAKRLYSVGLFLSIVASVVVCGGCYLGLDQLTRLCANELTYDYVYSYLEINIIGGIFKVLIYNFTFYLRLEGKLKRSSASMLVMTAINILLDYVFLFVLDMGIKGAAWASVIATFIACLLCFIFLYTDNSTYNLPPRMPKAADYPRIFKQGSSMALNNISSSLRILSLNLIFKMAGINHMLVIFAILNNINEFTICIQNGVPQTGMAMAGILYGGKEYKSLKSLIIKEIRTGIALSGIASLLLVLLADYIPIMFGSETKCFVAILLFAIGLLLATSNSVFINYYCSIQRIDLADLLTVLRILVYPVVICFIFRNMGNLIWLLFPLSEALCLLTMFLLSKKKDHNITPLFLIDEAYEDSGIIYSRLVEAKESEIAKASIEVNKFCEQNNLSAKKAMILSLSIEEMLMIVAQKSLDMKGSMDLRVLKNNDDIILRIRSTGQHYNPFAQNDSSIDYLGVTMIEKMATNIEYQSSLGLNTLIICI